MKATNNTSNIIYISCLLITIFIHTACKKAAEVPVPANQIATDNIYNEDVTATSVLTGLFAKLSNGTTGSLASGLNGISAIGALSADEFTLYSAITNSSLIGYYHNALTSNLTLSTGGDVWNGAYQFIYTCNSAIAGITAATTLTPAIKQQLLGEAKFSRAALYFYLVNLYGDVPLVISTDYSVNGLLKRTPKAQVYQQIITDLKEAQNLLSPKYLNATLLTVTVAKIRPTSAAATALLARTYLYTNKFDSAEAQATTLINNSSYSLSPLNSVFLANSKEAIWQLQPVNTGWNTEDARTFVLNTARSTSKPYYLSSSLLSSFEIGDGRRSNWVHDTAFGGVTYSYPYKYKSATLNANVTEYLMVLRLGEQYLIRAEARAQQNNLSGAASDLNVLRARASATLPPVVAINQSSMLSAVAHERQVELFTEWGHRWLDLKRTGTVDAVMGTPGNGCAIKGGTWNTNFQWFPIPYTDISRDINLTQNAGY